jgi:tetratricopeptide (TPR) repeat protein
MMKKADISSSEALEMATKITCRSISARSTSSVTGYLVLIFILLFSLTLSAQDNTNYPEIRQALDAKNLWLAKKELSKVFPDNPNDPALTFYQAEIWIQEGEVEYAKGNFRNAWEYYSKAHEVWASHPTVRRRYEELRGKKLVNNAVPARENNENNSQKPRKVAVGIPWMFGLTGEQGKTKPDIENTSNYPEQIQSNEVNLSFKDIVQTKDGKSNPSNTSIEKSQGSTKIVYISDSSNLEEVKTILAEINQDLKQIKNFSNKENSVMHVDANAITLSRNFVFNTIGLFGVVFVSLIFFIFKLSASVNELQRRKK